MAGTLNTPDVLTQPIATNGTKNSIPNTNDQSLGLMSQSTGFPAICSERIADGGKAPKRADFNGAFNLLSQQHFFLQNGGQYTFRQDVSDAIGGYPLGAMLFYTDSNNNVKIVRSLKQNNTANFVTTPSYIDDGTNWETVVPTVSWCNNTFVSLSTSQIITAQKTISANFAIKDPNHALGTYASSAWSNSYLQFLDKNNTRIAYVQPMFEAGTDLIRLAMMAQGSTTAGIWVRSDGLTSAPTPTTTNQTSHTTIATTGWVNTVGNGVMHLSGAETANGDKTFTGNITTTGSTPIHYFKSTNMDITSSGWASGRNTVAWCQDKNGHEAGGVFNYSESGGNAFTDMYVASQKSGSAVFSHLRVWSGSTGATWASCPASDVNGSILTTVSKSKVKNGYVKLGNGIIIQWGRVDNVAGNSYSLVNLPTAFTSTDYTVVVCSNAGGGGAAGMMFYYDKTTTTFKLDNSNVNYQDAASWIAIGW